MGQSKAEVSPKFRRVSIGLWGHPLLAYPWSYGEHKGEAPGMAEAWRAVAEAAEQEHDAAVARAEAAEAEVKRWREPQGELDLQVYIVRQALNGEPTDMDAQEALDTLRAIVIGSAAALNGAQLRYHEAQVEVDKLRAELATARAEGAAAERAAVVACLHGGAGAHSGFGRSVVAVALRDHAAYIEAGAHVRPVEGA